jgi:hypothetical protein
VPAEAFRSGLASAVTRRTGYHRQFRIRPAAEARDRTSRAESRRDLKRICKRLLVELTLRNPDQGKLLVRERSSTAAKKMRED